MNLALAGQPDCWCGTMTDPGITLSGSLDRRIEPTFEPERKNIPPAQNISLSARAAHYIVRPVQAIVPSAFAIFVVLALVLGWLNRNEGHLTAEIGIGYWLGIAGSIMMLLLLFYPLRKRLKFFRHAGRVALWFRLHMILGVVGPVLVIFHSNFRLGSLNSSVAFLSMLTVAISGLIGRYLYAKIHMGLYGSRAEIRDVFADAATFKQALGINPERHDQLARAFTAHEERILPGSSGVITSLVRALTIGSRARRIRRELLKEARSAIRDESRIHDWSWRERRQRYRTAKEYLTMYMLAVRKAALLSFYDRLFAGWHVLHLPLFVLLILAAIAHVIAVHLY